MHRPHWSNRKKTVAAVLFCLGAAALFFRGPLFLPKYYHIPYDLEDYHLPLAEFIASSLRESGQLPLWNPYSYMGEPFMGNLQAAMFYPPTMLTVLVGNALLGRVTLWVLEWELVLHVALAGIGTYVMLRVFRTTFYASLAGSLIYQLGAFFASQTQHLGAVAEAAWLPWFLASLYRLEARRDWGSAGLSGVCLALMILPGFPAGYLPLAIFAPLLYVMWSLQRHPVVEWRAHIRAALLLVVVFLLGGLLSAVSWLPGYQIGRQSIAAMRAPAQALVGLPLESASSLVWPNLLNQLSGQPWSTQNITFLHLYQGVPALLLVFGSLVWLIRSPRSRPFLTAAIIAALWMFGSTFSLSFVFYGLFPEFVRRGIYPDMVLAYFCLFFGVLAAFALDSWQRGERAELFQPTLCLRLAALVVGISLAALFAGAFTAPGSLLGVRSAAAGGSLLLVALSLGLSAFLLRAYGGPDLHDRRRFSAALCVVILLDLVAVGSHNYLNTYESEGDVQPKAVDFLRTRLGAKPLYRIGVSEAGYSWQVKPIQWRIPSSNGMNPLLSWEIVAYQMSFAHLEDRQFILDSVNSPLFDLAGIRYIVTDHEKFDNCPVIYKEEFVIHENPRAFPRFFLAGSALGVDGVVPALDQINKRVLDASRVVVVPTQDLPRFSGIQSPACTEELGGVELLEFGPNAIRVRASARRPAALVATEVYAREWQATMDGHPCPLIRADGIFRAIPVPAGTHEIRMFIKPTLLYRAAIPSVIGLLLTACCLFLPGTRETVSQR